MHIAKSTYLFVGLMLMIFTPRLCFAQDSTAVSFPPDDSKVQVRTVDAETLQHITNEKVFEYNEQAQNPETLLSRIKQWILQMLNYALNHPWVSVVVKFAFFAIVGIVLVALINQILSGNVSSAFSKKKPAEHFSLNIGESELSQTDYESMLKQAIAESHYRDAVRILYLQALQQLNEAELIQWKPDKTNRDYVQELAAHPAKTAFSRLTTYYEYVEYGDFAIEENGFQNVQTVYAQFRDQTGAAS